MVVADAAEAVVANACRNRSLPGPKRKHPFPKLHGKLPASNAASDSSVASALIAASVRKEPSGTISRPPPGYQPIVLPGESISKYSRMTSSRSAETSPRTELHRAVAEPSAPPLASTFPEDEPLFADGHESATVTEERDQPQRNRNLPGTASRKGCTR